MHLEAREKIKPQAMDDEDDGSTKSDLFTLFRGLRKCYALTLSSLQIAFESKMTQ